MQESLIDALHDWVLEPDMEELSVRTANGDADPGASESRLNQRDGLHPTNLGRLVLNVNGPITTPLPCTPRGVMELLRHAGAELEGAEAVVLDLDSFLAAINRAEPGLIRVEATETVPDHRFQLGHRQLRGCGLAQTVMRQHRQGQAGKAHQRLQLRVTEKPVAVMARNVEYPPLIAAALDDRNPLHDARLVEELSPKTGRGDIGRSYPQQGHVTL